MIIYGAGMAGLIAAAMLRRFKPRVLEARAELPQSHKAVLRFRTPAVAAATGIPFKQCRVSKALRWKSTLTTSVTLQQANAYSYKVTGAVMPRSINRLESEDRWIAPENFIPILAEQCDISFNCGLEGLPEKLNAPAVSTIPLPTMVGKILALKQVPSFEWKNILVLRQELDIRSEVYQTIYYPEAHIPYYRASLEGRTLIIEWPDANDRSAVEDAPSMVRDVLEDFGLGLGAAPVTSKPSMHMQPFGKILPVDEKWRRDFIFELTQKKNVYSLGRFATWRPTMLLDDVVKDVEQIERMVAGGDSYGRRLHSS